MISKLKALLFKNSTVRQTVLKNTSWLFIGELSGRIIRFSIVVYAAKILGAASYGIFSYALTLAAFLTIFSDLGISPVLTKETARLTGDHKQYFGAALILKLILIAVNAIILFFAVPAFARAEAIALFPFVFFVFAFDSFRELGFAVNRALETMEREAYAKIFLNATVAILGFVFIAKSPTPLALMWAYVIGTGLGLVVTIWLLRKHLTVMFGKVRLDLIWPLFRDALPVGLLGILGAISINTDMIMIGWWRSAEELGYYAVSQKVILLLYIVPTLLSSAAFPVFSRLANVNNDRFRLVFEKMMAACTLLAFPIAVGGALTAPSIISWFGSQYLPATATLQILFFTILVLYPSTVIPNALFAYNKQKFFITFAAVGALGNVLLNWLLIPTFGIVGAALATVFAQLAANTLIWIQMKRTNHFTLLPHLTRIVPAVIVMAAVVIILNLLSLPLSVVVIGAAAVYLGMLIVLKEPLFGEIKKIVSSQ